MNDDLINELILLNETMGRVDIFRGFNTANGSTLWGASSANLGLLTEIPAKYQDAEAMAEPAPPSGSMLCRTLVLALKACLDQEILASCKVMPHKPKFDLTPLYPLILVREWLFRFVDHGRSWLIPNRVKSEIPNAKLTGRNNEDN